MKKFSATIAVTLVLALAACSEEKSEVQDTPPATEKEDKASRAEPEQTPAPAAAPLEKAQPEQGAQSPTDQAQPASADYMLQDCSLAARQFFGNYMAEADVAYEGQRTDGTHAVNGTINLGNKNEDFQCSYNPAGNTMVDFYAEGESQPNFVSGGGSPHQNDAATTSSTPTVGSSTDLTDFKGARAGQAEMGIQSLGFELARTEGLTAYWLNADTNACARIVTGDGRYASVEMVPTETCSR